MSKRRLFGLALAVGGLVSLPALGDEPAKPGEGKRAKAFIEAFDKGDAKAVAEFWTPNGEYVDQAGRHHKGRDTIQKLYEKVFAARKGAKLTIHVNSLRKVTDDVVVEDGITEVSTPDGGPPTVGRFSAVVVKKDGEWYFDIVREEEYTPPTKAEHFADLDWIIGDWEGQDDRGNTDTVSYSYAENGNFILASFTAALKGVPVVGGTQWIGYDAVKKKIRSWSFYSDGGFGQAAWGRDGDNKWTVKTTAQTGDGKEVAVTVHITREDADTVTVQRTDMTVNGEKQPDSKPMKVKRVKPKEE
jgi:uncharacterized protein (TIGR02246 family)